MAGTIGKLTAAMTNVHNENSAALANLNFDFTLVKLDTPAEFNGLGATISKRRKTDAEEGPLHRTARRLGALFKDVLPSTDELFRAYGTRVSEIASIMDPNQLHVSGTASIFASYVGPDSTSIWAAATSGGAAIAAHLLGCMLARMFTGPEAISIWVELVQKQKESIHSKQENGLFPLEHNMAGVAAQQEISRDDLGRWDASARAWLEIADQVKLKQHTQTRLILNNVCVSVNRYSDPYSSVIKAWVAALNAVNGLLKGMPQRTQDGAALLALSSWHLYPDMIVYGGTCEEVKQQDPLFDATALLTLGLQEAHGPQESVKSVYWSLPLSRLQYYGDPVQASRSVGQENSRITSKHFAYIALGCVFGGWREYAATNEDGLYWIERFGNIVGSYDSRELSWLHNLVTATHKLSESDELEKKAANQLINLGRRRSTFIHTLDTVPPPLFGLSALETLLAVLNGPEERVQCLRQVSSDRKLHSSNILIMYSFSRTSQEFLFEASSNSFWDTRSGKQITGPSNSLPEYSTNSTSRSNSVLEYASIKPIRNSQSSMKRDLEGNLKDDGNLPEKYCRWITLSTHQLELCCEQSNMFNDPAYLARRLAQLNQQFEEQPSIMHMLLNERPASKSERDALLKAKEKIQNIISKIKSLEQLQYFAERRQAIEALGEICLPVLETTMDMRCVSRDPVPSSETRLMFSRELEFLKAAKDLLEKLRGNASMIRQSPVRSILAGNKNVAALVSVDTKSCQPIQGRILDKETFKETFISENIRQDRLHTYFFSAHKFVRNETFSLQACATMTEVYRQSPGATISTLVVKQPIHQAKWFLSMIKRTKSRDHLGTDAQKFQLTLPEMFACIAMFESGTCNLDPSALSEVFAMSSRNSLYIIGTLLCDPFELQDPTSIQRVTGNLGRAGITFLISPPEVRLREADPENWKAINHSKFTGQLDNCFNSTSVHLSFTEYEMPLVSEGTSRHIIDRDVVLLESLLSVYEKNFWVGEIDIIALLTSKIKYLNCDYPHEEQHSGRHKSYQEVLKTNPRLCAIGIENWDELIESPQTENLAVCAYKNWIARLAATAVCAKTGVLPIVMPEDPCWTCCSAFILYNRSGRFSFIC